jgi:hypothetical protein
MSSGSEVPSLATVIRWANSFTMRDRESLEPHDRWMWMYQLQQLINALKVPELGVDPQIRCSKFLRR